MSLNGEVIAVGLFRSREKEQQQFTAAYRRWMANFKASEFEYTGPRALPMDYLQEMHRIAVNAALSETYRHGQTIRIPDQCIDDLFWNEVISNTSRGLDAATSRRMASKKTTKRPAKKASKKTTKRPAKKASKKTTKRPAKKASKKTTKRPAKKA